MLNDYYKILSVSKAEDQTIFKVELNPDCQVYQGHFPGEPVSPGVCNIQMLRECAEAEAGKALLIKEVQQCRFTTLISPQTHPQLEIALTLKEDGSAPGQYSLRASILSGEDNCLSLKALLSEM